MAVNYDVVIVILNHYVFIPLTVCVWKPAVLIGVDFISSGRRLLENGRSAGFFLERSPFGCYFICPFVVVADCCIYLDTSKMISTGNSEKKPFYIAANQVRFSG